MREFNYNFESLFYNTVHIYILRIFKFQFRNKRYYHKKFNFCDIIFNNFYNFCIFSIQSMLKKNFNSYTFNTRFCQYLKVILNQNYEIK